MPANRPAYTIYNDPAFSRFIAEYFGWEHHVVKIVDQEKEIAELPFVKVGREWVSIPHGSVVGMGSVGEGLEKKEKSRLVRKLVCSIEKEKGKREKSKGLVDLEMLNEWVGNEEQGLRQEKEQWQFRGFDPVGEYVYEDKVLGVIYPGTDPEEQFSAFSSNLRRKVRKAAKNGITVIHGREELLDDFYKVYSHNSHRLGSPFFKKDYYGGMLKAYPDKNARFFVAYIQEKAIGASFLLGYRDYWENIYFATTQKFNPLYPSYLLNWQMIQYAMEQKSAVYSFGRSTAGSGTHQYKKQWGCKDLPLYWSHSHPQGKNIRQFAFLAEVWKRLPYGFCKMLGPGLAKRVV